MAVVMAGGLAGFGAALVAFFALDLGALTALGLWMGSGPLSGTLALALAARDSDDGARPA